MRKLGVILICLMISGTVYADQVTNAGRIVKYVYSAFSKSSKVLSDSEIVKLSKLSDGFKGTKELKKVIGKMNLPKKVQEDTYLRIEPSEKSTKTS